MTIKMACKLIFSFTRHFFDFNVVLNINWLIYLKIDGEAENTETALFCFYLLAFRHSGKEVLFILCILCLHPHLR